MNRKARIRRRARGFTLLEVLMVIVILGVLAAVIVPNFISTGDKARKDLAREQVTSGLATQLELFRTHTGRYPTTEEGLAALLTKPDDETIAEKWGGPYVKKTPKDPWGHELIYRAPGEYNADGFDLSSAGPDGVPGNDDDVTNWERT